MDCRNGRGARIRGPGNHACTRAPSEWPLSGNKKLAPNGLDGGALPPGRLRCQLAFVLALIPILIGRGADLFAAPRRGELSSRTGCAKFLDYRGGHLER